MLTQKGKTKVGLIKPVQMLSALSQDAALVQVANEVEVKAIQMRLAVLLTVYLAASLLHFAHNAEFLGDYPNLPTWLTRSDVYLVWVGQAVIGLVGFALYLRGRRTSGLLLIGLFAACGFDGLLHYTRAPFDEHTIAMNFTIWFEVAAAAVLLVAVVFALVRRLEVPVSG